jgi:hypothetical protein
LNPKSLAQHFSCSAIQVTHNAITGSTEWGDACTQHSVAAARLTQCAAVNAVI